MSKRLQYPPKPWDDGQIASLIPGIEFIYSLSLKKWVPLSPGYNSGSQLNDAFGVSTITEVKQLFETKTQQLDSEIEQAGRIWKQFDRPVRPKRHDMWYEENTGNFYSYNDIEDTWVEINYVQKINLANK
jgi:hypothetical protein